MPVRLMDFCVSSRHLADAIRNILIGCCMGRFARALPCAKRFHLSVIGL
jgi:hypothetical protein